MATDYVLRVLYERLARAFDALETTVSAIDNSYTAPRYSTVALMLAAPPSQITTFARCSNYAASDGIQSLWQTATSGPDNGSDVRESTYQSGIFYQRIWSSDGL